MAIDTRPPKTDISCYAGDTLNITFRTDVDYSAWTWSAEVRGTYDDTNADATFTFTPQVQSGPYWECVGTLSATDTASLMDDVKPPAAVISRPGQYKGVWDVQVDDGAGVVKTLVSGTFTVDPDVTRA